MNCNQILNLLKEKTVHFDAHGYDGFLAIQVTLKDLDAVFYVEIKNKKLSIEPYDYVDRQAHLIIDSAHFIQLANQKLNPVTAFTLGQLKVEGDIGKALELANILKGS